jgi:hypothetical protein
MLANISMLHKKQKKKMLADEEGERALVKQE